jgi:hypothetical protein
MKHAFELEPFRTPNFVIVKQPVRPRQEGFTEAPKVPLSELSVETLNALCEAFREEVLTKAGKI